MLALGDDVELLVRTAVAGFQLDGDQVLAEIARGGVDGEALPVGGFDGCGGEGARGGGVAGVGFGGSGGVEDAAGAGDGGAVGEAGGVGEGGAGDGGVAVWEGGKGGDGEAERGEEECFMAGGRGLGVGRECGAIKWIRGEWRKEWKDPSSR